MKLIERIHVMLVALWLGLGYWLDDRWERKQREGKP